MFPGRFWTALASGEAMNESITGERWPSKDERVARLEECVDVIRRLLAGEVVNHTGHVTVDRAKVWDRPEEAPPLLVPAVSAASAARAAAWADGLITVNQDLETLREVIAAYRGAGGQGPLALQLHLSWAPTVEEAERIAFDQWRSNVLGAPLAWDIATVEGFDAASEHITLDSVRQAVRISDDLDQHVGWICEYADLGFARRRPVGHAGGIWLPLVPRAIYCRSPNAPHVRLSGRGVRSDSHDCSVFLNDGG